MNDAAEFYPDLPPWRESQLDRHNAAERAWPDESRHPEIKTKHAELWSAANNYHRRRQLEDALADYIMEVQREHRPSDVDLERVSRKLHSCRRSGCWGWRPDQGRLVTAWDQKCNQVRLCPDEARQETKRLARRYVPVLMDHAHRGDRIYYAVLTVPNVEPGKLAAEKKKLYKRFSALLRKRKNGRAALPIKGALVTLEDPLSADGHWNIHLNVLMVTPCWLDFGKLREAWHWDVHVSQVRGNVRGLEAAFRELVKYSGAPVSVKSHASLVQHSPEMQTGTGDAEMYPGSSWDRSGVYRLPDGCPTAPPMLAWPGPSWLEWWDSQQRFRRTRSYGCLYRTPEPDREDLDGIEWLGSIYWNAGGYRTTFPLNLIPADNFASREVHKTGPPRRYQPAPFVDPANIEWLDSYNAGKRERVPPTQVRKRAAKLPFTHKFSDDELAEWLNDYDQGEHYVN